jgi:SHS2 domain-containing protein
LPHHVCPHCGAYKGKEVIKVEAEDEKALLYSWLETILIKFDAEENIENG